MTSPASPDLGLGAIRSPQSSGGPLPIRAENQETDLWYGGYAVRTMLPSFIACLVLSAAVVVLVCVYRNEIPSDQSGLALLGVCAALGAIWLFQLVRWGYRAVALHARLTTRRLFYHRGLFYPDWKVLPLQKTGLVEARVNAVERLLGVGRVAFIGKNPSEPPIVLEGIRNPGHVAELARKHLEKGTS